MNPHEQEEPQHSRIPSATSPTGGMEVIRTPGVTREEYAEKEPYTENILNLDARLLQDIISGRWSIQQ